MVVRANKANQAPALGNLLIGSLSLRYLKIGKAHALNVARESLKTQIEGLQQQAQYKLQIGSFFFRPQAVDAAFSDSFLLKSEWSCFTTLGPICGNDDDTSGNIPFARSILCLISRSLNQAYLTLKLVSKSLAMVLRVLRETNEFVCIAVSQRATFVIHGFHPPTPSQASITSTLCWRGCSVLSH
jgi:hypothetical protein